MQTETVFDLRYNIAAMYIAILRDDVATPEQAFAIIEDSVHKLTDKDTADMINMRIGGMSYKEIAEIYGISDSSVIRRIKRYKKRDLSDCHLKRSV